MTATADLVGERDRTGPASVTLPWTLDVADGAAPEVVLHCRPHPGLVARVEVRSPQGAWVGVEQGTAGWDQLGPVA